MCGDNWERLPQEGPNDFVGVRRFWGTPSSSGVCLSFCFRLFVCFLFFFFFDVFLLVLIAALDRPLLNSVWQGRISRILDIEDRRYNIFIEPDLLATFSLGPVPSSSVKALLRANKKRESFLQYMVRYLSYSSIAPFFFFFDVFLLVLVAALDRPLLNSVWQGRISRILDIEDRRYNIFIEPDLLATFSLGPVPSSSVKALLRANKKRESFLQYMVLYLSYSSIALFFFF